MNLNEWGFIAWNRGFYIKIIREFNFNEWNDFQIKWRQKDNGQDYSWTTWSGKSITNLKINNIFSVTSTNNLKELNEISNEFILFNILVEM